MKNNSQKRPKVVVVGAGFGGLSVAKTLGNKAVDVLLLDRNNYHGFWPLLYQVATGGLESASIAYPIRGIIRPYKNVDFRMASVTGVDFDNRQVLVDRGEPVPYDYLVLAAGSAENYFGNDTLAEATFTMKDVDQAERLRNQVIKAFEDAQIESDPERRKQLMTVAIVGAGPTGVELAGAYTELFKHDFRMDFPSLNLDEARVILIEALDKILGPFHPSLQNAAYRMLEERGVEIMLQKAVSAVEPGNVRFEDGTELTAGTVIWTAGVRGAMLGDTLDVKLQRGFRVPVTDHLNLPNHPEVFVIGDMAHLESYSPRGTDVKTSYPMVAPVANQMGQLAAKNILVLAAGGEPSPFKYFDKGSMAIIGRNAAILDSFGVRMTRFPAWLAWLAVHLMFLFGWRNRLVAAFNWLWNWTLKDRGARVVTGQRDKKTETMAPQG